MKTYKFRAECSTDVINFFRALEEDSFSSIHIQSQDIEGTPIPDVDVIFNCNLRLARLIQIAKQVEDCHVIAQTVRPIDQYTGERNYNI